MRRNRVGARRAPLEDALAVDYNLGATPPFISFPKARNPARWQCTLRGLCAFTCFLLVSPVLVITIFSVTNTPLSTAYRPLRNPSFEAARYRAAEQNSPTFSQWWYVMITDALTNETFSIGLGAFRGANESGGWVKSKTSGGGATGAAALPIARLTAPFTALAAAPPPAFDIRVSSGAPHAADSEFHLSAIDHRTLALRVNLRDEHGSPDYAWADLTFERTYGVFGTGEALAPPRGPPEACALANLPFAYASRVRGSLCVAGGCGRGDAPLTPVSALHTFSENARWRAYIESTVTCGEFPAPGERGLAPELYPWKWMWAISPTTSSEGGADNNGNQGAGQLARGGTELGEVGLVMSAARLAVPLLPRSLSESWVVELDVEGVFAFIDLPSFRLSAINVTLALASARAPFSLMDRLMSSSRGSPLLLSTSPDSGTLRGVTLSHGEWANFTDSHGTARIPLRQTLRMSSDFYAVAATFITTPSHYTRLAVRYTGHDGSPRITSDFRASAARAYIRIAEVGTNEEGVARAPPYAEDAPHVEVQAHYGRLVFEGYAVHNALEFAYHADFKESFH